MQKIIKVFFLVAVFLLSTFMITPRVLAASVSVDLKANNSDSSLTLPPLIRSYGAPAVASSDRNISFVWTSQNASTCSTSSSEIPLFNSGVQTSGNMLITPDHPFYPKTSATYTITCYNSGGQDTDSITVTLPPFNPEINTQVNTQTQTGSLRIQAAFGGAMATVTGSQSTTFDVNGSAVSGWTPFTNNNTVDTPITVTFDKEVDSLAFRILYSPTFNGNYGPATLEYYSPDGTLLRTDKNVGGDIQAIYRPLGWGSAVSAPVKSVKIYIPWEISTTIFISGGVYVGVVDYDAVAADAAAANARTEANWAKFKTGDTVLTTTSLNVRSSAGTNYPVVKVVSSGTKGVIETGPNSAQTYTWWKVRFSDGTSGWSVGDYLEKYESTSVESSNNSSSSTNTTNTGSGTSGGSGTSSTTCLNLTTSILEGSSGMDVALLQDFLRAQGFLSTASDGKFGPKTSAAVSAFQIANGIESVGSVGPVTRAKIYSISCGGVSNTTSSANSNTSTTTTKPTTVTSGNSSTVQLKANGVGSSLSVSMGTPVVLSWAVSGQTSCYKSSNPPSEFTGALVPLNSGTTPVYPTSSIEYKITCGNYYSSVVINVGGTTFTGSTSNTTSTSANSSASSTTPSVKFAVGDTVASTTLLNVRSIANVTASVIATVPTGTKGTVWGGPVMVNGENWWNISFANVAVGWSVEKYLIKTASGGLTTNFIVPGSNVTIPKTTPTLATCAPFDYDVSKNIEASGQITNPNVIFILPSGWTYNKNVVPNTVTVPGSGTFPVFPTLPIQINYNYATPTPTGCGGFAFTDNTLRTATGALLRDFRAEGAAAIFIGGGKTSNDVFRQTNGTPLVIGSENICEMAGVPAGTNCTNFFKSAGIDASLPTGCASTSGYSPTTGKSCSGSK
jgi:uncharacterized protein YgiM (DUF1202 family)